MRTRTRSTRWVLRPTEGRSFTVLRRDAPCPIEGSHEVVLAYVRKHMKAGDKVFEEEPDGYRTSITKKV